eukprot:scaffold59089_cov29-Tisochrysis_lutea.AAC.1
MANKFLMPSRRDLQAAASEMRQPSWAPYPRSAALLRTSGTFTPDMMKGMRTVASIEASIGTASAISGVEGVGAPSLDLGHTRKVPVGNQVSSRGQSASRDAALGVCHDQPDFGALAVVTLAHRLNGEVCTQIRRHGVEATLVENDGAGLSCRFVVTIVRRSVQRHLAGDIDVMRAVLGACFNDRKRLIDERRACEVEHT